MPAAEKIARADRALADPYALSLPNLRAAFLPDPGHVFIEADLARADAQVIAWEAGAHKLKKALRDDEDIHTDNAIALFASTFSDEGRPRQVRPLSPHAMHSCGLSYRDCAKRWVHATNFGGRARTLASAIVLPIAQVETSQHWWKETEHPEIGELHRRLEFDIHSRKNPVIHNAFGFRRLYVGGDRQSNLLGQALAWIAQSTVAVVINTAMLAVDCARDIFDQPRCGTCLRCRHPWVHLLLQVHDSLLIEVPARELSSSLIAELKAAMSVTVPYDDPLIIASTVKWSDRSWGHMQEWKDREAGGSPC